MNTYELSQTFPIGILDSGLGGLSVLQAIWQSLPQENTIYLADSKYAPYGDKSLEFIQQRTLKLCNFLIEQKVKAIVIACNTATTNAINYIREIIQDVIIIGVEPGIKPAFSISKNKIVGVLATENTLKSENFSNLVENIIEQNLVKNPVLYQQSGNGLVELIETQNIDLNNENLLDLIKTYINPMLYKNVDTIVLGCTHYPFLLPILNTLYPHINFVETAQAIVSHLKAKLLDENLLNNIQSHKVKHLLLSSLDEKYLKDFIHKNIKSNSNMQIDYSKFDIV